MTALPLQVLLASVAYLLLGYACVRFGREHARARDEERYQRTLKAHAADAGTDGHTMERIVVACVLVGWPGFAAYALVRKIKRSRGRA